MLKIIGALAFVLGLCSVVLALEPAQVPLLNAPSGVTIYHPMEGVSTLYDQQGNSATVIQSESLPGMAYYSQENKWGHPTQQGFLYDPIRPTPAPAVPKLGDLPGRR